MKSAHLDTHDLTLALETLARESEPDESRMLAALRLANLLMLYESIRYDGDVNVDVRQKLDAAIAGFETRFKIDVRARIMPYALDRHAEERAVAASVDESFAAILRRMGNPAFDAVLTVPLALRGPDDPEKHLFEPMLAKRGQTDEEVVAMRRNTSVQGHRFYAAIYRNDEAIGYIRDDPNGARQRLKHLFCLFRMQLSEHRVVHHALNGDAAAGAFCYFPFGPRQALLSKVQFAHADLKAVKVYRDLLEPRLATTALPHGRELCRGLEAFPLPPIVGTAVAAAGANRERFVEAVFAYRASPAGGQMLDAIAKFAAADPKTREEILEYVAEITGTTLRNPKPEDGTLLRSMYVAAGKGAAEAYKKLIESRNVQQAILSGRVAAVLDAAASTGVHFEKALGRSVRVGTVLASAVSTDARAMANKAQIRDLFGAV